MSKFDESSSDLMNVESKEEFISNHAIEILNKLNEERKSSASYCDVTIKSRDQEFPAHKCVLGVLSDFYDKMFTSEMKEKYERVATVDGVNAETMQIIMDFIYTCKITITMENVYDILKGADYMQMMSVKEYCESFLLNQINLKNCLNVRACGKMYNLQHVSERAQNFITENLISVVQENQFKELDVDDVSALLQRKEEEISEERIYHAVVDWVKHELVQRKKHFFKLFQLVKLEKLCKEFLEDEVLVEELVMSSHECKDLLLKAICSHIPGKMKNQTSTQFLIMGGKPALKSAIRYDTADRQWIDIPTTSAKLLNPRSGATAVNLDRQIYLMGGDTDSVERLSLKDPASKWQAVTSMKEERQYAGSAVLDGYIYVVGGSGGKKTSERYNPQCCKWFSVTEMHQARSYHGVVSLQGLLYAVGGKGGDTHTSSVECFNPLTEIWKMVSCMKVARSGLTTVVLNDEIYAIGGFNKGRFLSSVEKYSPETDTWCDVAFLIEARNGACACAVNGKIYVVGGCNASGPVRCIEVYDPDQNEWKIDCQLKSGLFRSAIACV